MVTLVVEHLGWVDLDMESSRAGGLLSLLPTAQSNSGTYDIDINPTKVLDQQGHLVHGVQCSKSMM